MSEVPLGRAPLVRDGLENEVRIVPQSETVSSCFAAKGDTSSEISSDLFKIAGAS
jgi:hypothetical protein